MIAQRVIAYWWRRKKGTLNHRQRNQDPFDLKMKFRRTLNATMVEVDDCAGMSKKIEQIAHRSKYIQRALDSIADKLWEPEVLESMSAVQTQTTDGFASTQSPMAGARLRARRGSFVVETEARMMSRSNAMFSKSMTVTLRNAWAVTLTVAPFFLEASLSHSTSCTDNTFSHLTVPTFPFRSLATFLLCRTGREVVRIEETQTWQATLESRGRRPKHQRVP